MRAIAPLPLLLLLAACDATPLQGVSGGLGLGAGSIAVIQRTPLDAAYSILAGRDCSVVRLDRGESYCRPPEPPPEQPPYCTKSLGTVDCWPESARERMNRRAMGDGPDSLTDLQEAHRTRRWPE